MRSTYLGIGIASVIVLAAIIYGFASLGAPWKLHGYQLDASRMSDFSHIADEMQSYYSEYGTLPATLDDLMASSYGSMYQYQNKSIFIDPDSRKRYEYKMTDANHYQLCTTFVASSDEEKIYNQNGAGYYSVPIGISGPATHPAGYTCLIYSVRKEGQNSAAPFPKAIPALGAIPQATGTR